MRTALVILVALSVLPGSVALGQVPPDIAILTEKILIPLPVGVFPGAFGSEWQISVALTNLSGDSVVVGGPGGEFIPVPAPYRPAIISPQTTVTVLQTISSLQTPAVFFRTEPGKSRDLAITLRSQDLSRQSETWGSVVPVVREGDLLSRRCGLPDVPMEPQFRAMLRLYDVDSATPPQLRVRIYKVNPFQPPFNVPQESDQLLLEVLPVFTIPSTDSGRFWSPAYAEMPLWLDERLTGAERVRVEIEPLDGRADYWAFVSVTHNETQHVTIITP